MPWKPNLKDVPLPIPTHKFLNKAVWKLYTKHIISNPKETFRDDYGVFGYRYPQFILLAKKEPYGNIVSVDRRAVLRAIEYDINILLWLNSAGKFYLINPYEVMEKGEVNHRGNATMLNFNISLCKPYPKVE